eukprot:94927-Amphidinium_carterae.3
MSTSGAVVCDRQPERKPSKCLHLFGSTPGLPSSRHCMLASRMSSGTGPAIVMCTRSTSSVADTLATSFANTSSALCVASVVWRRVKKYTSNPSMPCVEICACSRTW